MSQIQNFANNHSTKFARIIVKLVNKYMLAPQPNTPNPVLNASFVSMQQQGYVHRVLYAYYKCTTQHSRNQCYMQAQFVRMLRNNPQYLVKVAHTPTAYM